MHLFEAMIVGRSIAEARESLLRNGFMMRETVIDGQPQMVTQDFSDTRINVETSHGVVVKFVNIG